MPGRGCPKKKGGKHRKHTPIVSKAQRGAMGAALAAKRGKRSKASLKGAAKGIARSMSEAELARHLEESKGKKLPARTRRKRKLWVRPGA
jgi:hypothetical protein